MCTAVCNTDIRLLNGTAIDANKATGYGGGIYAYAIANTLSVTAENSSVSGNTAAGGAGIFTYKSGSAVINVDLQSGAVMHNNNAMTDMGGAIYAYNAANINIAANSAVYNNTAKTAGDDLLFNGSTFTLPNAKDMSGDRILFSDKAEITGWYHDGWLSGTLQPRTVRATLSKLTAGRRKRLTSTPRWKRIRTLFRSRQRIR